MPLFFQSRGYATEHEADLVVIGSGPGGYVGAIKEHTNYHQVNTMIIINEISRCLPTFLILVLNSVMYRYTTSWASYFGKKPGLDNYI